jgi:hypothetical protein
MDPIQVAKAIESRILRLDQAPMAILERAKAVAVTDAEYDKELGSVIAQLEMGKEFDVEGVTIKHTTATVIKEKAKAICWEEKLAQVEAKEMAKAANKNVDNVCAQLNGYQSINKYLDVTQGS